MFSFEKKNNRTSVTGRFPKVVVFLFLKYDFSKNHSLILRRHTVHV